MSHITLSHGASLEVARLYDDATATRIMERLLREVSLGQYSIRLFGREVLQPRLVGWAGELPYTYSGFTLAPRPLGPTTHEVLELVNQRLRTSSPRSPAFNHILFNLYRDGSDSMGMHSDDEPELGADPVIGSLSLGGERTLTVTPKKGRAPEARLKVPLRSGELVIMHPPFQRYYLHGVPKMRAAHARLNVTFRHLLAPNSWG